MKCVSGVILFVLFALVAEDAVSAHATAQDNSATLVSLFSDIHHDHTPVQNCESTSHRDSSHFGHCSFLLLTPLAETLECSILVQKSTWYFFSLKTNKASSLLRPPIKSFI